MKIEQLKSIQTALTFLAKKQSTLAYVVAKNLNKVNSAIKHADNALSEAKKPFLELNEKGEPKTYYGDAFGNTIEEVVQGNKPPEGAVQLVNKITDKKGFAELAIQYSNDEHEISWHEIPESKLEEEVANGNIEAEIIAPLLGVIFIEKEKTKE